MLRKRAMKNQCQIWRQIIDITGRDRFVCAQSSFRFKYSITNAPYSISRYAKNERIIQDIQQKNSELIATRTKKRAKVKTIFLLNTLWLCSMIKQQCCNDDPGRWNCFDNNFMKEVSDAAWFHNLVTGMINFDAELQAVAEMWFKI